MHLTLTCEYRGYRWCGLTKGASLRDKDGFFPATTRAAVEQIDAEEARAECRTQIQAAISWGVDVTHLDAQMNVMQARIDLYEIYLDLAEEFRTPGADALAETGVFSPDTTKILRRTFGEVDGYNEMIVLRGVAFESHCEHHIAPIIGRAWVGYIPERRGWESPSSPRVVEILSKRLQIQERLTAQIANSVEEALKPRGVAVVVKAAHHCMTHRGVHKRADLITSRMLGVFREQTMTRSEFLSLVNSDITD